MKNLLYILLLSPLFFISSCEEEIEEDNIPNEISLLGSMWTAFYPDDFQGYSYEISSLSIEFISLDAIEWWIVHTNGILEGDGQSSYQWIGDILYLDYESLTNTTPYYMQLDGNVLTFEYEDEDESFIINFHKQ